MNVRGMLALATVNNRETNRYHLVKEGYIVVHNSWRRYQSQLQSLLRFPPVVLLALGGEI